MSKEYFTENISDEMLAKLIDKTLRFEKNNKTNNKKANIFKIIPAVAAVVLFIGLVNLIAIIPNIGVEPNISGSGAEVNIPFFITNITEDLTKSTTEEVIDPYAHVRFGETRDILLLNVEWHTYDTYYTRRPIRTN